MKKVSFVLIILSLSLLSCSDKKSDNKGSETTQNVKREVPEMMPTAKPAEKISTPNPSSKTKVIAGVQFHIIAASYNVESQAQIFRKQLYRKGYPSKVLYNKGKYRVTLVSFPQKEKALSELKRLRKLNQKPDLWLLKQ